ncbi:hypothetical protein AAFC00_000378 [Neodothiora populina]|uniref:hydroxymethylglutaryl-CoA lyase n=1 Tax=Neodothiora populina TaxID=2781224 RepID=A0ABR3PDY3_9PEZI
MPLSIETRQLSRYARQISQRSFATAAPKRSTGAASDHVRLVEVGPRDGLQNEKTAITLETKVELVRRLARTGLQTIEAGSFVSPKWVPQMANSDKIMQDVLSDTPESPVPITYQWLLPNMKGLDNFFSVYGGANKTDQTHQDAYPTPPPTPPPVSQSTPHIEAHGPRHEVSIFMAATESFSQRNTNCSIAESLERFGPLMTAARDKGFAVRAYISVALGCPFEGPDTDPHRVAELSATLLEMGADEISVADTTGMGTAPRTRELLKVLAAAGIRNDDLALHFHDTYGQALVNTLVGLEHGVRTFDSAVGGLGGCPYSPGATGNVSTEDVVYILHSLGLGTGVDLNELSSIGDWITSEVGKPNESRAGKATLARLRQT